MATVTDSSRLIRHMGTAERISRAAMLAGASQDPSELHQIVAVLLDFAPRTIAEIGCDQGGGLFAWRNVASRVLGITLESNLDSRGASCESYGAQVRFGDSHDPRSLAWLAAALDGDPLDVLVIDGDHSLKGVTQDLIDYGPLVRPGGLILLNDILPVCYPAVRVHELWARIRDEYDTEQIGYKFGWGIIRVREGDRFDWLKTSLRSLPRGCR